MKTTILKLMLIATIGLLASCEKEVDEILENEEILGVWNLSNVSGGLMGTDINYEEGDVVWDFEDEDTVIITNNIEGTEDDQGFSGLESGTYSYEILEVDGVESLHVDDNSKGILAIDGDVFGLDNGLPVDGYYYEYAR